MASAGCTLLLKSMPFFELPPFQQQQTTDVLTHNRHQWNRIMSSTQTAPKHLKYAFIQTLLTPDATNKLASLHTTHLSLMSDQIIDPSINNKQSSATAINNQN